MAVTKKGVLGLFSGKVGSIVGSKWRTLTVLRAKRRKSDNEASEKQVQQRKQFGKLSRLLTHFRRTIQIGFHQKKNTGSEMSVAMKYNMEQAVVGEGPDFDLDMSKVVLSMGNLFRTTGARLVAEPERILRLTWNNDEAHWSDHHQLRRGNDYLMVALMFQSKTVDQFRFDSKTVRRSDLEFKIRLKGADITQPVHLWIFFVAEYEQAVSKSEYYTAMLREE